MLQGGGSIMASLLHQLLNELWKSLRTFKRHTRERNKRPNAAFLLINVINRSKYPKPNFGYDLKSFIFTETSTVRTRRAAMIQNTINRTDPAPETVHSHFPPLKLNATINKNKRLTRIKARFADVISPLLRRGRVCQRRERARTQTSAQRKIISKRNNKNVGRVCSNISAVTSTCREAKTRRPAYWCVTSHVAPPHGDTKDFRWANGPPEMAVPQKDIYS
ncbi:hypothetical protein EVAR_27251_1 [Eumeta japonica]|uniref:Uncharacterized protein n=1 Tax=Eumeta variegata TaxID=151549 RepID=A0A4C1W284_EUMVA|nr:hypothetical protein EVAR_27251_1 [Eumeta japonica]